MRQRTIPAASSPPTGPRPSTDVRPRSGAARRLGRGGIALAAALALATTIAGTALAVTGVVLPTNTGGITAVGPVNGDNGFPAWYQDKGGTRVELCLDGNDPMCGFVAAPVPGFDNTQPTVFNTNFPDEAFYALAGSTLTLPNGGRAVLTLALEAAFVNNVVNGDQQTFARQRIFVTNGPASTQLTFHQPYGDITIDTDATGRAHFTEDIAPSVGNFTTPLNGHLGPFLTASNGPVVTDSGSYLGDPAVPTTIKDGPHGHLFSVDYTDAAAAPQHAETDQFSVQGKISTNTGFDATAAVASADGKFVDVFADSKADLNEVFVNADSAAGIPNTPMALGGATSFYARVPVTSVPAKVTLSNIGDAPTSTIAVNVTKASPITVTDATYDGTTLHVAATSTGTAALSVAGYANSALVNGAIDITTPAPPGTVSVTDGTNTGTAPVRVTGGVATPPGEPPTPPSTTTAPVCTTLGPDGVTDVVVPCVNGAPATDATPKVNVVQPATPIALGDSVVIDASTSTNATSYKWAYVSGPQVSFTNGTTAKPTVKLAPYTSPASYPLASLPKGALNAPAVVSVVAVNGTTESAAVNVTIPVKVDTVTVTTNKFTAGKEYRVDGTSTIPNGSLVLNPPTTVNLYNTKTGLLVGSSPVDTTGAWSVRIKAPFPAGFVPAGTLTIVTTRGGFLAATVPGGA
jgi:hypothetical protein